MEQLTLSFQTASPINKEKLSGQNKRLYDYLMTGKPIHVLHPAKRELQIGYLNSRASDLINKFHVPISKKYISVPDVDGNETTVVEYSIK